ncbi:hypothetical protein LP7551_03762 [Roseibium album]|nr:hypothetical protein LP7551_03762 [Roseibium album]
MALARCALLYAMALLGSAQLCAATTLEVRYSPDIGDYALGLLELGLSKSDVPYELIPADGGITQARNIALLKSGDLTVGWFGTSRELEATLLPVRLPLMRGLLGHRICIIAKGTQDRFSPIRTLEDFRKKLIGQGADWPDVRILEGAGFTVKTAPYSSLFGMAAAERFDCFLRGVTEAHAEVVNRSEGSELAVERDLMIVYPYAALFFVSPKRPEAAAAIEQGLRAAYNDDSFMAYFNTHPTIRDVFSNVQLDTRRRFELPNPNMSAETLAIDDRFWHDGNETEAAY